MFGTASSVADLSCSGRFPLARLRREDDEVDPIESPAVSAGAAALMAGVAAAAVVTGAAFPLTGWEASGAAADAAAPVAGWTVPVTAAGVAAPAAGWTAPGTVAGAVAPAIGWAAPVAEADTAAPAAGWVTPVTAAGAVAPAIGWAAPVAEADTAAPAAGWVTPVTAAGAVAPTIGWAAPVAAASEFNLRRVPGPCSGTVEGRARRGLGCSNCCRGGLITADPSPGGAAERRTMGLHGGRSRTHVTRGPDCPESSEKEGEGGSERPDRWLLVRREGPGAAMIRGCGWVVRSW